MESESSRLKEEVFKVHARLLELIASQHSFDTLLNSTIAFLEHFAPEMRCGILIADSSANALRVGAAPNLATAFVRAIDGSPIREGEGSCGTAAYRRELVIVGDIATSPLWESKRGVALEAGIAACWSMPLFDNTHELIGTLAMYYAQMRVPKAAELELISVAGSLAGMVIQRFRDSEQLRTNELRYRELADKCPDPIIAHVKGRLIFVNQAARALLQIEAIGTSSEAYLEQFVPEQLRNQWLTHQTGLLVTQLRGTDGLLLGVEITATPLTMDHQLATMLVVRDVSRRIAMESVLFDAESRLHEHLAFDLHDGVGQQLTGVSLMLRALSNATTSSVPALTNDFQVLSDLVSKCISDIRILAGSMAPVTVTRVGLAGALKVLRQKAESIYGLEAQLSIEPAAGWTLDSKDANHLFRLVQEAIGNVARHANASRVEIAGRDERGDLVLTIADDGIGITAAAFSAAGLGLRSMRYRTEKIGGELTIKPHLPRGTLVQVRYPMQANVQNSD